MNRFPVLTGIVFLFALALWAIMLGIKFSYPAMSWWLVPTPLAIIPAVVILDAVVASVLVVVSIIKVEFGFIDMEMREECRRRIKK